MATDGSKDLLRALPGADDESRVLLYRELLDTATQADLSSLRPLFAGEKHALCRRLLAETIARLEAGKNFADDGSSEIALSQRMVAIQETTQLLLHELRPRVGWLEEAAAREITEYRESETAKYVGRIRGFMAAVEDLRTASASPRWAELNLTDVILETAVEEARGRPEVRLDHPTGADGAGEGSPALDLLTPVVVQVARVDQFPVMGDEERVRLALANALRNAIESCASVPGEDVRYVSINWGVTPEQSWVAVLDEGVGLPHGVEELFTIGASSKNKDMHMGMGLTIARNAMLNMGGDVSLTPGHDGGAICRIWWPRL